MTTSKEITIEKDTTISKYLNILNSIDTQDLILFRGQSNSDWQLSSTAYRRLLINRNEKQIDQKIFIEYNKDILERARIIGYGKKESRKLTDLELLSEIQHYEGATCLIDFSRNFLVALWFASTIPIENGAEKNIDGCIFIIQPKKDSEKYRIISSTEINKEIDTILKFETKLEDPNIKQTTSGIRSLNYKYWIWEPESLNNRILQQDSSFIFGRPLIDEMDYIRIQIKKEDKKALRQELTQYFNICSDTLFKDLPGFASKVHSVNNGWFSNDPNDLKQISKNMFRRGRSYFDKEQYDKAFEEFNNAIKLHDVDYEYYVLRGRVLDTYKKYSESIIDYKKAIELFPQSDQDWDIYYLLAAAYLELNELDDAEKWFKESLKYVEVDYYSNIALGYISFLKEKYLDSINHFNDAFKYADSSSIGLIHAHLAQSYGKLGKYQEMIQGYKKAFSNDYSEININLDTLEATIIAGNKAVYQTFRDEISKNQSLKIYPAIFTLLNSIGDLIFFNIPFNESAIFNEIQKNLEESPTLVQWSVTELKGWCLNETSLSDSLKDDIYHLLDISDYLIDSQKKKNLSKEK